MRQFKSLIYTRNFTKMKEIKYPIILALVFIILVAANNQWAKYRTYKFYHEVTTPAQPIREELKKDELLNDEAGAETFVINLWATWCGPCQKEIPQLNKILRKYENEKTLFLAITGEKEEDVYDWIELQKHEPEYFMLFENKRLSNYIFSLNPNTNLKQGRAPELLPTNVVIHKNEVVFFEQGYSEKNIMKLDSILSLIQN